MTEQVNVVVAAGQNIRHQHRAGQIDIGIVEDKGQQRERVEAQQIDTVAADARIQRIGEGAGIGEGSTYRRRHGGCQRLLRCGEAKQSSQWQS